MLGSHKNAFIRAAKEYNCWIGLREPNALSDKYIGKPGFIPKPNECCAKTADAIEADNNKTKHHPFGGLVVSPKLYPEAFKDPILALEKWKKFIHESPSGFTIEHKKGLEGLVKYNDKLIHADFDIMYLNFTEEDGSMKKNLVKNNDPDLKGKMEKLFLKVSAMINIEIGANMIQPGIEFFYEKKGARDSEHIYRFGPKGQCFTETSSTQP